MSATQLITLIIMGSQDPREVIAATDDIMISVVDGYPIPTNAIDRLTPWRARIDVKVALLAGAQLQHGTPEQFEAAAVAAGKADAGQVGWWRKALGLPQRPELTPAPLYAPPVGPPRGWSYVSGESGTRTREGDDPNRVSTPAP